MEDQSCVPRPVRILGGISGIAGILMIGTSFMINPGPPPGATPAQLIAFGTQYYPRFCGERGYRLLARYLSFFSFTLVHLAGANKRISGWMTFFGAGVLMAVSLIEITFYIAVLFETPPVNMLICLNVIYAVQHLYFIVAAPAFFIPLGIVLVNSDVLSKLFGYLAILLGLAFTALGMISCKSWYFPCGLQAFAGIQAIWWLTASVSLIVKSRKITGKAG